MIYINKHNNEYGVYVTENYLEGEILREFESSSLLSRPTRTSIQVGPGQHIEDRIGMYVNHACVPNCEIDGMSLIATKDLFEGDEITFDYNKNEDLMASPFECKCCGKMIAGRLTKDANFDGAGIYLGE